MNILKRTLAGLLVVYLAFGQVTVIPGDWVQGFSSLTTTGSNVYVTGTGTIGQDTSFTRSALGRYTLYDATASTGVTTLTVRAGAGQSSTNLLELKNAAGTTNFSVQSGGRVDTDSLMTFGGGATASDGTNFVVGTAGQYLFSASTQWSGSKDLGLTRSSAGLLKVTNGSSGDGNIIAGNFKRGTGDPNSVITGSVGDLFLRTDGGASTTLYVKESGSATNTGWVAK